MDNIRKVASLTRKAQKLLPDGLSFKLILAYCTVCYKLSMSTMLTIFDVSIKEKRVYGSLCFALLLQQMSKSQKKYIDLCQLENKYKQVALETLF